ncbi:MAG: YqcC family protein [Pseudomonadales bacterium]|nr:YqcC family protein [Pseudomonadales bacterium]
MKKEIVRGLLADLHAELLKLDAWEDKPPSESALKSLQPFAVDALRFNQWLQWIFIPKMLYLLDKDLALPNVCGMQPMIEGWGRECGGNVKVLSRVLLALDQQLSL